MKLNNQFYHKNQLYLMSIRLIVQNRIMQVKIQVTRKKIIIT